MRLYTALPIEMPIPGYPPLSREEATEPASVCGASTEGVGREGEVKEGGGEEEGEEEEEVEGTWTEYDDMKCEIVQMINSLPIAATSALEVDVTSRNGLTFEDPERGIAATRKGFSFYTEVIQEVRGIHLPQEMGSLMVLSTGTLLNSFFSRPYYCILEKLILAGKIQIAPAALMGMAHLKLWRFCKLACLHFLPPLEKGEGLSTPSPSPSPSPSPPVPPLHLPPTPAAVPTPPAPPTLTDMEKGFFLPIAGFSCIHEALGFALSQHNRVDLFDWFISRGFIKWTLRSPFSRLSLEFYQYLADILSDIHILYDHIIGAQLRN